MLAWFYFNQRMVLFSKDYSRREILLFFRFHRFPCWSETMWLKLDQKYRSLALAFRLIPSYKESPNFWYVFQERLTSIKRGCVFPMIIWPAVRMGQCRVNDHPYHAPQFKTMVVLDRHGFQIGMKSQIIEPPLL